MDPGRPIPDSGAAGEHGEDRLRIAMVCPYDLGRPGGVQSQVKGLARALARRGHEVVVVAPGRGHSGGGEGNGRTSTVDPSSEGPVASHGGGDVAEPIEQVVVGRAVGVPANGSVAPVCLSPRAGKRAVRAVTARGCDVVHFHEPFAPLVGYSLLRRHPRPAVGTFHRAGRGRGYRTLGPLARRLALGLDVRCAVSEEARQTLAGILGGPDGGEGTRVLFNGVETDRFPQPGDRRRRDGPVRLLFVGRHEPRKGLITLLEALSGSGGAGLSREAAPALGAARAEGEGVGDVELTILGEGPMTSELRRRFPEAAGRHWLGAVDDAERDRQLLSADVLCAPSLSGESFGVVVLEGLAAGALVVASELPGYRQASGGHAELVAPGDVGAWRAALTGVAQEARRGEGAATLEARRSARRHAEGWSMGTLAARYDELYRAVLGRETGPGAPTGPR